MRSVAIGKHRRLTLSAAVVCRCRPVLNRLPFLEVAGKGRPLIRPTGRKTLMLHGRGEKRGLLGSTVVRPAAVRPTALSMGRAMVQWSRARARTAARNGGRVRGQKRGREPTACDRGALRRARVGLGWAVSWVCLQSACSGDETEAQLRSSSISPSPRHPVWRANVLSARLGGPRTRQRWRGGATRQSLDRTMRSERGLRAGRLAQRWTGVIRLSTAIDALLDRPEGGGPPVY